MTSRNLFGKIQEQTHLFAHLQLLEYTWTWSILSYSREKLFSSPQGDYICKKQPDWHQVPHLTQSYEKPFIFTVQVLLQKTRDPQVTHALIFRRKHSATLPAQKLSTLNTLAKEKTFLSTSLSSAQLILQAEELKLHLLTKWPVYPILQAGSFQILVKDGRLFWQTYRR